MIGHGLVDCPKCCSSSFRPKVFCC